MRCWYEDFTWNSRRAGGLAERFHSTLLVLLLNWLAHSGKCQVPQSALDEDVGRHRANGCVVNIDMRPHIAFFERI